MSKLEKHKPTPTRYFAAWEIDRSPPNCVPRLCSLTINRLSLLTTLPPDLTSLSLAVKMQSSKRTLRSHEIPLPQLTAPTSFGGIHLNSPPLLETDLDLHFSLQYPHFLKRDGNRLLILLQRRKRYKTRTILGYKTLAEGVIRMDAVLQKSMDITVELNDTTSKNGRPGFQIATIRATQVSSSPVDQDNKNNNSVLISDRGNEFSDDDEEQDFSSNEDNDDGLGLSGYASKRNYASKRDYRKLGRNENDVEGDENLGGAQGDSDSDYEIKDKEGSRVNKISRQRNFKQKIVALLKRFRPEELEMNEVARRQGVQGVVERDLDALFHELESLSCGEESGQDIDSISIGSTPKPSLRPFFNSKKDNNSDKTAVEKRDSISDKKLSPNGQEQRTTETWRADSSGNEGNADADAQTSETIHLTSPPRENPSASSDKKKTIFRTTSSIPTSGSKKKQSLIFTNEPKCAVPESSLSPTSIEPRKSLLEQLSRVFNSDDSSLPEILSIIGPESGNCLVNRLTTLLSTNIRAIFQANNTAEIKAILQTLMNKIQKYCNSTAKPPSTIKVLLLGGDWLQGTVLRHYVELLGSRPPDWLNHIRFYIVPIVNSAVSRFLSSIDNSYASLFGNENWQQLCCNSESTQSKAETMEITNRIQRYIHSSGPCTQIPIGEALVAVVNYKDEDSCQIFVPFISDVRLGFLDGPQLSLDLDESATATGSQLSSSPPNTGRVSPTQPSTPASLQESLELQVDYWPLRPIGEVKDKNQSKSQDQGKNSVKSSFKNFHVSRLPVHSQSSDFHNAMTLFFSAKEKKQKIMRLGKKKEKDKDGEREQCIDGIARLICSAKQSHPAPLRVYIDGTEWSGVKFFQLSSQWQTHVKNFPVALVGAPTEIL